MLAVSNLKMQKNTDILVIKILLYRPVTVYVYKTPAMDYVGEPQKTELCKGRFLDFGIETEEYLK